MHVACGRLDAYFEDGFGGPWDVAAVGNKTAEVLASTTASTHTLKHREVLTSSSHVLLRARAAGLIAALPAHAVSTVS